jgi:signal peptidase I
MRGMIGSVHESILLSTDREDRPEWISLYLDILRQSLAEGLEVHLPVSGRSMRPMIAGGATLVVGGAGAIVIRPGDIVVYEDAGHVICHRVLWRRRTPTGYEVLTKGDSVALPPAWVPASALIGRVVAIETCGVRRRLDEPGARVRAFVVVGRAWAGLLRRRLTRVVRTLTMPARAA